MSVLGEGVALHSQGEEGDRTKPPLKLLPSALPESRPGAVPLPNHSTPATWGRPRASFVAPNGVQTPTPT